MHSKFKITLLLTYLMVNSATAANGAITVISANTHGGAWIGYSDGTVRYCNGEGGTAIPFWTACNVAIQATGSAVTDIGNNDRRAWIGHKSGKLSYCRDTGSNQKPLTECVEVEP